MCDAVQVLIASIRIASGFPALAPRLLCRSHRPVDSVRRHSKHRERQGTLATQCERRVVQHIPRGIGVANINCSKIIAVALTLHASTTVGERRRADATRMPRIAEKFERYPRIH